MDCLVGLRGITLGCLAGAEHREERSGQLELHQLGDAEQTVLQVEAALECVGGVLRAVTGKVHDRRRLDVLQDLVAGGCLNNLGRHRHVLLDDVGFLPGHRKGSSLKRLVNSYQQRRCIGSADRLERLLSVEKGRDGRCV
jgi:hypothetical protein